MLTVEKKAELINEFGGKSGSAQAQVAILTARITYLTDHFKSHKKDHHSKTGMMKMIGRRRSLLKYIKNRSEDEYQTVISKLGLRK